MKLAALLIFLAASVHAQILSSNQVQIIAQSIFLAEGGTNATYLYGVRSVKYKDAADAKRICENSIRNNYSRWIASGRTNDFIPFFAARYAPYDQTNWTRNVSFFVRKLQN